MQPADQLHEVTGARYTILRGYESALPVVPPSELPREASLLVAKGYPTRFPVAPHQQEWDRPCPDYAPPSFEAPWLAAQDRSINPNGYADPAQVSREEFISQSQSGVMRSFEGPIRHDPEDGRPLCPLGRMGITGRGNLGKWGPNHAADAIVTRVSEEGALELLIVKRPSGEWAVPGGFVDAGETALTTALRELGEETGIKNPIVAARPVYTGIVRDPRTTDNAWIETSAFHLHFPRESDGGKQELIPEIVTGKPCEVKWATVTPAQLERLYANHGYLVRMALSQDVPREHELPDRVKQQLSAIEHAPLLTSFSNLHGRIGILGGSFDPVHVGHLALAREVKECHNLDAVVFVPAAQNPLKPQSTVASPPLRVAMLEAALTGQPGFLVSPVETRKPGPSFTINLIDTIRSELPPEQARLFLIMGADCVPELPQWREYERLLRAVELIPIFREGYADPHSSPSTFFPLSEALGEARASELLEQFTTLHLPDISSTTIRAALSRGESPEGVPPQVAELIHVYRLYQDEK